MISLPYPALHTQSAGLSEPGGEVAPGGHFITTSPTEVPPGHTSPDTHVTQPLAPGLYPGRHTQALMFLDVLGEAVLAGH
jgi:hypothetical protein